MMDRYIMHMCIADWSDVAWLPSFNEVSIAIFEMPANELHNIKMQDEDRYNKIVHQATCHIYDF